MEPSSFTYLASLASEIQIPHNSTLSRTLHSEGGVKTVLFAFDAGQELSEHTAARPAIVQFLSGQGTIKLAGEEKQAQAGTWVYMAAGLVHAIRAETPLTMLLTLLPKVDY